MDATWSIQFYILYYSDEDLAGVVESIISEAKIDSTQTPHVYLGMDTR